MENTEDSKPRNYADEAWDRMAKVMDDNMATEFERAFTNYWLAPWYIRLWNDITGFVKYKICKPIENVIKYLLYYYTKPIRIRPVCGGLDEAMARSGKIRNTEDFANWIRKEVPWLKEYGSFHCELYSDEEDERIGWRKTYILLYHDDKDGKSYPFAYTDKDIAKGVIIPTNCIPAILGKLN